MPKFNNPNSRKTREKSILCGLFLSKFDSEGLDFLGFNNFIEAYNLIGLALNTNPNSIKLYRDECDPQFPNRRMGRRKREMRQYIKDVFEKYKDASLQELSSIIKGIVYANSDVDILMESIENTTFAKRLSTGQAAENMFCYSGQNWGFPTYKWDILKRENFSWWRRRVQQASKFYHAYRIDHVLGFFRIWVVPDCETTGILGNFVPSVPIYASELLQAGIPRETIRYLTHPNFGEEQLKIWFGANSDKVKQRYLAPLHGSEGRYVLKDEFRSEKAIFALDEEQCIKDSLLSAYWDRVFTPSSTEDVLHPFWYWYNAPVLLTLPEHEQNKIKNIIRKNEQSQEDMWRENGCKLLSVLAKETDMLVCAEDLGAVPDIEILPLQDFMSLSQKFIPSDPAQDRVNTPGTISTDNWSWRMPILLDDLLEEGELNGKIKELAEARKRISI